MSSSRLVKAMLQYNVDAGSIRRVVDSTRKVNAAMNDLKSKIGTTGVSADKLTANMDSLRRMTLANANAAGAYSRSLKVETGALTDAQRAAKRLNDEINRGSRAGRTGGSVGTSGSRGARNPIQRLGAGLVGLPDVGPSTDVGQGLRFLGATGIGFGQLAAVLPIVAPAAIAAAIAVDRFVKEIAIYKQALDSALKAQRTLSEARTTLTSDEARAARDTATRRRDALQGDVASARQRLDDAFADVSANFGDLGARLTDNVTPVSQLREEYEALRGQYLEQQALVGGYTADLEANAYALQDLILIQQQATEQNARYNSLDLQERLAARTLTTEAANDRIAALEYERDTLDDLISTGSATGEQLTEFRTRLDDISVALFTLNTLALPFIAAREREERAQQNLTDRIEATTEAMEEQAKAEEQLGAIAADILEAGADSARKLADIQADLVAKTAEAEHDLETGLAEAERDAGLAREDAVVESNEALEEAEVEHRERLAKIQKDYARDFESAVGERDALAAYNAQQARKDATDEESKDYDKRRKEIDKRLQQTNDDIARKLAEQSRTVRMRYEEQLRTASIAAQRAVQIENARAIAQIAALQATFNAQQAIVADWASKVINYTTAVSNAVNGLLGGGKGSVTSKPATNYGTYTAGTKAPTAARAASTEQQRIAALLAEIQAEGTPIRSYAPGAGYSGFASGGRPPIGREFLVGEKGPELLRVNGPSQVFSNTETKRMGQGGGGFSVGTMIFQGRTRRELHREFDKYVTQAMEQG